MIKNLKSFLVRRKAECSVKEWISLPGMWTDQSLEKVSESIDWLVRSDQISVEQAAQLRSFAVDGYIIIRNAVESALIDSFNAELRDILKDASEGLRVFIGSEGRLSNYDPGQLTLEGSVRLVDIYVHSVLARKVLLHPKISGFLSLVFRTHPLLFQSLNFRFGSQQGYHQDTGYVVVKDNPLALAASWVALEDVTPGSGELRYIKGSHRTPHYLFSGLHKHWNPERDGYASHLEWKEHFLRYAKRQRLKEEKFFAKKGDVLIWAADLVHGGSEVTRPGVTRNSIVGHYCPSNLDPHYFSYLPKNQTKVPSDGGCFSSQYYEL